MVEPENEDIVDGEIIFGECQACGADLTWSPEECLECGWGVNYEVDDDG